MRYGFTIRGFRNRHGRLLRAKDSQPERPDQVPHDEDCFCCCAHVLAGLAIKVVETAEMKSPTAYLEERTVLSPPLPHQYRPPRIA